MTDVRMPSLSMNMTVGEIIEWLVADGDTVEEGDDLVEIESEKSVAVIDAPDSGTVSIAVSEGERVDVGTVIASIGEEAAEPEAAPEAAEESAGAEAEAADSGETSGSADEPGMVRATPAARRRARELEVSIEDVARAQGGSRVGPDDVEAYAESAAAAEPSAAEPAAAPAAGDGTTVRATPAARHLARDEGVELSTVAGSGPDGGVVMADVAGAATTAPAAPAAGAEPSIEPPVRDRQRLSGVREVIAERLSTSWREAPHVTVDRSIDVDRFLELVDRLDEELEVDVSINDLFLLALAETLERHPDFNATLEDGEHVRYDRIDIAIAVDTDRGLLTPVIRDVGGKSLSTLAAERAEVVEATLSGEVDPDRLGGGTFTVTNLGSLGVTSFTPIINPPQVAIMGISAIQEVPRRGEGGEVVFGREMEANLSFDHRPVDGADAARFLETFADLLGRPLSLVAR